MWSAEEIVQILMERGELWESAPGLVGLRGYCFGLHEAIDRRVAELCRAERPEEWRTPAGIPFEALARAEYFASFPQWLTAASHLSDDERTLERVATAPSPADAARAALAPARAALPPAVCYHVYHALADAAIDGPMLLTAQGTCWRHEGDRLRPLERGWAFTMREIVCIGSASDVEEFRQRMLAAVARFAAELDLAHSIELATDPFFAPTARGKTVLQKVKALKHELMLPIGRDRRIAAASFNNHETFFGEAFGIRLSDGRPAHSACVAFGLERWLLAFLTAHGPDRVLWPDLELHPLVPMN